MFQSSILSELTIMVKLLIHSNEMPRIYYTLFVYNRLFNKFVQRDFSNLLIATQINATTSRRHYYLPNGEPVEKIAFFLDARNNEK